MELAQTSHGFRALSIVAAVVITVAMAAPLVYAAAKIIL
jgi:hypothetical protein